MTTPPPDIARASPTSCPSPRVDGTATARALIAGAESVRRIEALLVRSEAACLAYIADGSRARILGAPSVSHVAEGLLRIGRRTAAERIALHRILAACPEAEMAFMDGRLSACQVLALAPILRRTERDRTGQADAQNGAIATVIDEAEGVPVRALRTRARAFLAARRETPAAGEDDPDGARFAFSAPLPFLTVWRETMDLARRVLGYDAPQYRCIEAILAEAGLSGDGDRQEDVTVDDAERQDDDAAKRGPSDTAPVHAASPNLATPRIPSIQTPCVRSLPARTLFVRPADLAFARETLSLLNAHTQDVRDLFDPGSPRDAFDAIDRLRQIHALHAPLRIIVARLIRAIRDTRAYGFLGHGSLGEFVEMRLGLSERSGRALVQESRLFEASPALEDAYGRGEIGIGKAFLIHGIAGPSRTAAFLRRARAVTLEQFRREHRFIELLRLTEPLLAARFSGPLPQPGLDAAMVEILCDSHGWTPARIDHELEAKGLGRIGGSADPAHTHEAQSANHSADPAANRVLMERLELLLDILVQSRWDEPPATGSTLPATERQMFAHSNDLIPIRFWAPDPVIADLKAAIARIRKEYGPALPVWMAMTVLFAIVDREWNRHDPESRPTQEKILRRDAHRCQSPLCGSRAHLEAHHIELASHGGSDDPSNLATLCHADHVHVIHAGRGRLTGSAPHDLRWELGLRFGHVPLLILIGNRIIGGECA